MSSRSRGLGRPCGRPSSPSYSTASASLLPRRSRSAGPPLPTETRTPDRQTTTQTTIVRKIPTTSNENRRFFRCLPKRIRGARAPAPRPRSRMSFRRRRIVRSPALSTWLRRDSGSVPILILCANARWRCLALSRIFTTRSSRLARPPSSPGPAWTRDQANCCLKPPRFRRSGMTTAQCDTNARRRCLVLRHRIR